MEACITFWINDLNSSKLSEIVNNMQYNTRPIFHLPRFSKLKTISDLIIFLYILYICLSV